MDMEKSDLVFKNNIISVPEVSKKPVYLKRTLIKQLSVVWKRALSRCWWDIYTRDELKIIHRPIPVFLDVSLITRSSEERPCPDLLYTGRSVRPSSTQLMSDGRGSVWAESCGAGTLPPCMRGWTIDMCTFRLCAFSKRLLHITQANSRSASALCLVMWYLRDARCRHWKPHTSHLKQTRRTEAVNEARVRVSEQLKRT